MARRRSWNWYGPPAKLKVMVEVVNVKVVVEDVNMNENVMGRVDVDIALTTNVSVVGEMRRAGG